MSALSSFRLFDLVKNVTIDGMHGIYDKNALGLWLDTKHHKMPWYFGLKLKENDSKLISI